MISFDTVVLVEFCCSCWMDPRNPPSPRLFFGSHTVKGQTSTEARIFRSFHLFEHVLVEALLFRLKTSVVVRPTRRKQGGLSTSSRDRNGASIKILQNYFPRAGMARPGRLRSNRLPERISRTMLIDATYTWLRHLASNLLWWYQASHDKPPPSRRLSIRRHTFVLHKPNLTDWSPIFCN